MPSHPRSTFSDARAIPPQTHAQTVERTRLTALAALIPMHRLTVVHAPAGAGKTTLLAQWFDAQRESGVRVVWHSMGDDEGDPRGLADYLLRAIERSLERPAGAAASLNGAEALERLRQTAVKAVEKGAITVFIDDFHRASEADATAVGALIGMQLPQFAIVLASRIKPSLPLSRLRTSGDVLEVTMDELRFNASETGAFFKTLHGERFSPEECGILWERTEGWAAGLRLLSLTLRGQAASAAFSNGPSGSHRAFAEYFLEEVIAGLPAGTVEFLVDTSILETLSSPLCEAVSLRADAGLILQGLESTQLFTVSLPGHQDWFRYHHLFQEYLFTRLTAKGRSHVEELHRRAAEWFVAAGSAAEAVRHAFLAHRPEWAAELIECYCLYDYLSHGRFETYSRWMQQLPREAREGRPLLMVLQVWRLINARRYSQAEEVLQAIEAGMRRPGSPIARIAHESRLHLGGRLHLMRALIGAYGGDLKACGEHLSALGDARLDHLAFGQVDLDSIHSYFAFQAGDLDLAERLTWKANRVYQGMECHWGSIHSRCIASMCYIERGRTDDAQEILEATYAEARSIFPDHAYMVALPAALLGGLVEEQGDLERAEALWVKALPAEAHTDVFGLSERLLAASIGLARLYDATGRADQADALLLQASRRAYEAEDFRLEFQLATERADRAFRCGRLSNGQYEMERLVMQLPEARQRFPLSIWQIWDAYGLAETRGLQARGEEEAASVLLRRLEEQARTRGRLRSARLIASRAASVRGDGKREAPAAEPVSAMRDEPVPNASAPSATGRPAELTPREHQILLLIREGLSNKQIARRERISVNTVKSHAKSIFLKLDVRSRTQAVVWGR